MSLFNFRGVKQTQAPIRKPPLMHPDNVPRTTKKLPATFNYYVYDGPAIEIVTHKGIRRPALVAHLVHEHHTPYGAVVQEEMTASLFDLYDAMHPQTRRIALALRRYYTTSISLEQQEEPEENLRALKDSLYASSTT